MEKIYEVTSGKVNIKITGDLESDKRIIVLIPGINGTVEYYNDITPYLQKKYTVIAMDLLGQGKSSLSKTDEYDMDTQAWAMLEGIARLRITDNMLLFGYGIGGLIANRMAELRDFSVSKLILLNTPANEKYAEMDANSSFAAIPVLGKMAKSPVKSNLYFAKDFDTSKLKNPNVINDAANTVDRKVAKKLTKMADDYLDQKAMNKRLRATDLPTLAIFSDDDQILTEAGIKDAKATIGRVPRLMMKDLKDAGHAGMLEQPEEVAKMIIDFDESVEDVVKIDM